jgi:hypothetical protein
LAPDYVTAAASRERLELANEAGSLKLALDAANTIRAQDSLESRKANWKHGRRSRAAIEERQRVRSAIRMLRYLATMMNRDVAD